MEDDIFKSIPGDFYIDKQGNEYEKWAIGWRSKKTGRILNRSEQSRIEQELVKQRKTENPFKKIRTAQDIDPAAGYNSYSFLQTQIKRLGSLAKNPAALMSSNVQMVKRISLGSMFLFHYDPKHKDTLPYYDTFPLVIPFSPASGGFLGLNLHYVPYWTRIRILDRLFDFSTDEVLNPNTKMLFSWQMLMAASKYKDVKPCIKHYLLDHVGSNFMFIDPRDWYSAAMMPTDRFVGAGKGKVWKHSTR